MRLLRIFVIAIDVMTERSEMVFIGLLTVLAVVASLLWNHASVGQYRAVYMVLLTIIVLAFVPMPGKKTGLEKER